MDSIDWSKAPESATHYAIVDDEYVYYKKDGQNINAYHKGNWVCDVSHGHVSWGMKNINKIPEKTMFINCTTTSHIDKQIYTQAMHDNGELPSVGMECMYKDGCTCQWINVEVMYISEWSIVLKQTSEGYGKDVDIAKHIEDVEIKPIDTRTDREKLFGQINAIPRIYIDDANELVDRIISGDLYGVTWSKS